MIHEPMGKRVDRLRGGQMKKTGGGAKRKRRESGKKKEGEVRTPGYISHGQDRILGAL